MSKKRRGTQSAGAWLPVILAILVVASLAAAVLQGRPGRSQVSEAPARIAVAEARDLVASGEAVLYDVRSTVAYRTSHIQGALHFPEEQWLARIDDLAVDKLLIFY